VAFRVIGADATVTMAVEAGQLQLNAFEPVIADSLMESIAWLTVACRQLRTHCVDGITANTLMLEQRMADSISVVTGLAPLIGYSAAAELAKEALATNRSIAELVMARGLLGRQEMEAALSARSLAGLG
jgi:aspartate ammonia-lyase